MTEPEKQNAKNKEKKNLHSQKRRMRHPGKRKSSDLKIGLTASKNKPKNGPPQKAAATTANTTANRGEVVALGPKSPPFAKRAKEGALSSSSVAPA